MSNIFVAGATGFTGLAIVKLAAARYPGRVIAHVRPDSPRRDAWGRELSGYGAQVDTTAWEETALRKTLGELASPRVFALLGTTRARGKRETTATYETVDYGLSAMLWRATAAAHPSTRFVFLSSYGVGPRARGAYLRAKWRLEEELRASSLDWVIARPGIINGPGRRETRTGEHAAAAVARVGGKLLGAVGAQTLGGRLSPISAERLGAALLACAEPAFPGRRVLLPEELHEYGRRGPGEVRGPASEDV